ncbi:DUF262 domain-containing protein [Liquorilactobacillus satsumensis]|uniref:DUF262 domain-containing protein n=1 Tax=Liquorilactobacillus TaxID=2767888 RepID=UPI0021C45414|nr:DUF262 domain-containing protein [Liquorilactobacillus satsumensis]
MNKKQLIAANNQIKQLQKYIDYDTRDYPIDYLVKNYIDKVFFRPSYQRNANVWDDFRQERFIESIILGYPIPLLFLSDTPSGKLEIVDGLQRISTLSNFLSNNLKFKKLDKLTKLIGFTYSDLPYDEQLRFKAYSLRVIVLRRTTDEKTRIDLFDRINTSPLIANTSEIRTGSEQLNPIMKLIQNLSSRKSFLKLINLSQKKLDRKENVELVSRFFAYSHEYKNFKHSVKEFITDFIKNYENKYNTYLKKEFTKEFNDTFTFITHNFPAKVFKNKLNQTPRVRFEALAVGTNLALKKDKNLKVNEKTINSLLEDENFKKYTTSDASNSRTRVIQRIEYVEMYLLKSGAENE